MKSAVTIGNFDGVHLGHQALARAVQNWKQQHSTKDNIKTIAVTFDPHPREILTGTPILKLCSLSEKIKLLKGLGIDEVKVFKFTKEFAAIAAKDFFHKMIITDLNAVFVAAGTNFFFGHGRVGSPTTILEWSHDLGVEAQIIPGLDHRGEVISSSRIRDLVSRGNVQEANILLGRLFSISDHVQHGDKLGRQLGFPTINFYPETGDLLGLCLPAPGVYLTQSRVGEEQTKIPSVTNIGYKPTIAHLKPLCVETHLLDFEGDLYGKHMTVEFKDRIRPEQRFSSVDELRLQIQKDIQFARASNH